jgi:hypothetical protein
MDSVGQLVSDLLHRRCEEVLAGDMLVRLAVIRDQARRRLGAVDPAQPATPSGSPQARRSGLPEHPPQHACQRGQHCRGPAEDREDRLSCTHFGVSATVEYWIGPTLTRRSLSPAAATAGIVAAQGREVIMMSQDRPSPCLQLTRHRGSGIAACRLTSAGMAFTCTDSG